MSGDSAQVLVAGGCHVHAYPIGAAYSFGLLAASAAGWEHVSVSKVSLRNPATLLEYLRCNPIPDVLVLQLGNYEAPYPIPRHARLVFPRLLKSWKVAAGSSVSSRWYSAPDPEASFRPTRFWRLRIAMKQIYAAFAQYTNPPLSDTATIMRNLASLLQTLQGLGVPKVIVLSPLPCADYMACKLRLLAAPIFEKVCCDAGVVYVNSGSVLGYSGFLCKRSFEIFIDERHLNAQGHRMIAGALAPLLVSVREARRSSSALV